MGKVVTLGEIMLRLSTPGNTRFVQSDSFDVVYGGGEANVAVSCANYGHEAYFVTKLPKMCIRDRPTPAEVEANGIAESALVSPNWLISTYLVLTFAELFLSPMGISFVSKVAPPKYKGAMMGLWFVATAIGNYLVAIIGYLWGDMQLWMVWSVLIVCCLLSALFIFSIMKKLEKVAK